MLKLSLIVAFAAVMLISSSQAVRASLTTSNTTLPNFLVSYAQFLSKGNSTELAIIENEMITQQQIKQERIAATNGAV